MSMISFHNKTILVTGGTRGLGKAIGLEFARAGAKVFLTHRWSSVCASDLISEFRVEGLLTPGIVECDASDRDATRMLMASIKNESGGVDVIVSNVAFAKVVHSVADLKKSSLDLSLGYSAWPVVDLIQAAQEEIGRFPTYVIAVSSDGVETCHEAYDLAGASKAVLETLCRYLAIRLRGYGVRVNVIRPGFLDTKSARATFGHATVDNIKGRVGGMFLDPCHVAKVCLALSSGLMDAVTGQTIVVDEGWSLVSPIAYITGEGLPEIFPWARENHP
jgi:NAD(P)-dependent dehydrogenase (short-subunit alcohol dehydrogenase family)